MRWSAAARQAVVAATAGLALLLYPGRTLAQIKADAGDVVGTVSDEQARRVPAVTIVLVDAERGLVRRTASAPDGTYRFSLMPPARYRLEFTATGFRGESTEVDVRVGETTRVDVTLVLAAIEVAVRVAAPATLDPESVSQSRAVTTEVLEQLPINRRNYLDFALLTPAIVESSVLAGEADFRVPIAPTSGLSFAGSNGRGNTFLVDGLSNNGATGNVRPSVPQEAVQEFQVNRSTYSAEYGGATGGVLNIVTKSGGNTRHGGVFALLRDRRVDARNYFDPADSAFTRVQAGGSLGGPIRKDRTFFFGAVEHATRRETTFVTILQNPDVLRQPTESQQRVIEFLGQSGDPAVSALANTLQAVLTPSSNPTITPLVTSNSGAFPLNSDGTQSSFRLDHRWSRHKFTATGNFTTLGDAGSKFGALVGYSHGSSTGWRSWAFAVTDAFALTDRWAGVTRVAVARAQFDMQPNDPIGPELLVGGFGSFGRDFLLPFLQREHYVEIQQAIAYAGRRSSAKFGVVLNPIHDEGRVDTFFGGRFVFGEVLPLGVVVDALAGNGIRSGAQAEIMNAPPEVSAALAQPITSLQALSLGLPVAYVGAFGNSASESSRQQHSAFLEYAYHATSWLTLVGGLRGQFNANSNLRSVSYVDPRAGIAWAPSGATTIRAGYGVFHSWVDLNIDYSAVQFKRKDVTNVFVPLSGVPTIINPLTHVPVTSADVYQYLLARQILGQRPVTLADLAPLGISSQIPFPVTGGVQADYTSPTSQQTSVEVDHVWRGLTIGLAYNHSSASHLWRTRDYNLRQVGTRPDGYPVFGLVDPTLLNNFIIESAGHSSYQGLTVQASRAGARWSVTGHYTLSRAIDDVTDFNIDYAPHNQLDPDSERGPSEFDERHRLVATVVFQPGGSSPSLSALARGWTIAAISRAHSGRPFNVLTGFDNLGDGQVNTHRPLGVGRNAGRGPAFLSTDVRVMKTLHPGAGRGAAIDLTLETFNLFNRTNFQSVNNIVGNVRAADLPDPIVGHLGDPATSLAFTSAFDARQVQLGVRVRF